MSKGERWEPSTEQLWNTTVGKHAGYLHNIHRAARRDVETFDSARVAEARAHYEPIVAELWERVETLQQKLSESIAREEQLENSAESWRRVSEQLQNEKRELESEFSGARSSLRAYQRQSVARIVELEAQLSRGVFVREMSDEEILATWHRLSSEGPRYRDAGADLCKRTTRACIAAATKLPEVSVRWTVAVEVDELCNPRTIDLTKAIVSSDHSSGRKGKLHIVFVPEVKP